MAHRSERRAGPPPASLAATRAALAPLGRALADHARGEVGHRLVVRVAGEPPEVLSPGYFFRPPSRMGPVDRAALELARGRVLDVGAGAGAHAVPLQRRGHRVTALEWVPEAAAALVRRGVRDVREADLWSFGSAGRWDTVLALMNGTALAGTAAGLEPLLLHLRGLVATRGRLLIDSTEVAGEGAAEGEGDPETGEGRGTLELHYQLEYRGVRGPPFPQLLVASETLIAVARGTGWRGRVVARQGARYLARLSPVGPVGGKAPSSGVSRPPS